MGIVKNYKRVKYFFLSMLFFTLQKSISIEICPTPGFETSITVCENTPLNGNFNTFVSPTGSGSNYKLISGPAYGIAIVDPSGLFTYSPPANVTGMDADIFEISLDCGPESDVPVIIHVNIYPGPMTSAAPTGNTCPGQSFTDSLANYTTPNTGVTWDICGSGSPTQTCPITGGTVVLNTNTGVFTFTPNAGFTGNTSFVWTATYITEPGSGASPGCTSQRRSYALFVDNLKAVSNPTTPLIGCINSPVSGKVRSSGGVAPITYVAPIGTPVGGTVTNFDNSTGFFTFTPTTGFVGQASFNFSVRDSICNSFPVGTEYINISAGPTANPGTFTTCENITASGNLNAFANGACGPLSFILSNSCPFSGGTPTIFATGPFTFKPKTNYAGPAQFCYTVSDFNGCSASNIVNGTINPAPIATSATINTCINTPKTGNLNTYTSGGTPPYTFTQVGAAVDGTLVLNGATGAFTFTPNTGFVGNASFQYQAMDTTTCPSTVQTITVHVIQVIAATGSFRACENTPFSSSLNSLVSGGIPPYTFSAGPTAPVGGTVVVNANGSYTFTPTTGFTGPASFGYTVADSIGCTATGTVDIQINESPVALDDTNTTCENTPVSGTLTGLVSGGTPPYSFSGGSTAPTGGTVSITGAGAYTFTPTHNFVGVGTFTYKVTDINGCSDQASISVTVRQGPTTSNASLNTCGTTPVVSNLNLFTTGGTIPYTFAQVGAAVNGTLALNPTTGAFTFTPTVTAGTGSFRFTATDSTGCVSNTSTITIVINRNPNALPFTYTVCENSTFSGSLNSLVSGGTPPYVFTQVGTGVNGVAVVNTNGSFTFTPTPGFVGNGSFQYRVTDSNGCVSNTNTIGIIVHQNPVTTNATIAGCNKAIVTGNLNTYTSAGTVPYTFAQVGTAVNGTALVSSNGSFTFIPPAPNFVGTGSFQYRATDLHGCVSNVSTVSVTFNQGPVLSTPINPLSACQNAPISGTVTVTGGTTPYVFTKVSGPLHGTVTVNSVTGAFVYTPIVAYSGTDSFVERVTDANGCTSDLTINFTVNQAPTAANDSFSSELPVIVGNLLPLVTGGQAPYTFTQNGPVGSCGSVVIQPSGAYTFTFAPGFIGLCAFGYTVTDANGCTANGVVSINKRTAPVAQNVTFYDLQDTVFFGNLNPYVSGGTPPYTFIFVDPAVVGGFVTLNPDGTFVFTPTPGFTGNASFEYEVVDSAGVFSNVATVTIVVQCRITDPFFSLYQRTFNPGGVI